MGGWQEQRLNQKEKLNTCVQWSPDCKIHVCKAKEKNWNFTPAHFLSYPHKQLNLVSVLAERKSSTSFYILLYIFLMNLWISLQPNSVASKSHLQSTRLQLSSFSIHFRAQICLTKITLKTLCQMSAPNPIKHCLDMAQVNTLATGCWLFWDVSFFLFMFCFLNHSVTNLKQMSKPLIFFFLHTRFFFFVSGQP